VHPCATSLRLAGRLTLPVMAAVLVLAAVTPASAAPGSVEPAASHRPVRVMSYNIHAGHGSDGRLDLARIAEVIRSSGADIVGLQEVDRHWSDRSAFVDEAAELARTLHMHVVYGADLDLDPLVPGQPRRQYGNAILTDPPVRDWHNSLLPRSGTLEQRGLLEALVKVRGVLVRVCTTQLQHDSQQERIDQTAAIRSLIGESEEPVVLTGDLNAPPDTPEITTLTEALADAWAQAGAGPGYTFPTVGPGVRIDYVLHTGDIVTRTAAVIDTEGSDHVPVVADLTVPD
jgi:endonuclease/exonuclease/phosphatase family metal-dependent hydrolase